MVFPTPSWGHSLTWPAWFLQSFPFVMTESEDCDHFSLWHWWSRCRRGCQRLTWPVSASLLSTCPPGPAIHRVPNVLQGHLTIHRMRCLASLIAPYNQTLPPPPQFSQSSHVFLSSFFLPPWLLLQSLLSFSFCQWLPFLWFWRA